ncbi:MAG: helix-turn-helix transcriptional regulator [Bacteroides sp.]|nr:helix-turn-helix transcriptional regulator [Bacteroides sp.]MCM1549149.1 helix-turn-helix transcriptional regulator [Clostridium sp.]
MNTQKRIRQLMDERGWTDYRLAKEASLSHSTVTNMFNRNNAPTLPTLEAVCRAFGITLSQFSSEGNDPAQLTEEQRVLFSRWSTLTEEQKTLLLTLMNTMKCNRIYKNTSATCSEVGVRKTYKEKLFQHPIHQEFTKSYNKLYGRIRRDKVPNDTPLMN